jgi:pyridoxine 4-dehydrogenase
MQMTFELGGTTAIHRLGYGAMQLTGPGVWGPPRDHDEAIRVLRRAMELGVDFIDTADSYGPFISEELIAEALHPYPEGLVIATKGGLTRAGPDDWRPVGRPEYLRQQCELSLRHLKLERLELYQLHRIDPKVPAEETLGELKLLQDEGKIRHIGLSEVSIEEIERAQKVVDVVSVQNLYNLGNRQSEDVLDWCEANGIAFIPWFPLANGRFKVEPQVALAWLLRRSPVMLPIPGTSSVAHLEQNMQAATLELADAEFEKLAAA